MIQPNSLLLQTCNKWYWYPSSSFEMYDLFYRLSTIQAADRIVVMDRGQIVEVGNFLIYFECPKYSYQYSFLNLIIHDIFITFFFNSLTL